MRAASAMTGGIVAAGLMLAPATIATAEPIAPGGAYATIGQLEASGYDVNIDRVGSAPLDQCVVTSVRNPQDITRTVKLKGADAVVVGIQPAVAFAMVQLGLFLGGVRTALDLDDGLQLVQDGLSSSRDRHARVG